MYIYIYPLNPYQIHELFTKTCWKKLEISPALPPKIEVRDFCAAQHEDRWEAGAVATGWEQIPNIPKI